MQVTTKLTAEVITDPCSDLTGVNAARVSFDKKSTVFTYRKDVPKSSDEGLVGYLAKENHFTPFTHARETFISDYEMFDLFTLTESDRKGLVCKRLTDASYGVDYKYRHSVFGWISLLVSGKIYPEYITSVQNTLLDLYPETMKAFNLAPISDNIGLDKLAIHKTYAEVDPYFIDVTMKEEVPLCVARQRFKHTVGFTYNEVSRRYVSTEPVFYRPDCWRSKPEGSIKQGSGAFILGEDSDYLDKVYLDSVSESLMAYTTFLEEEASPELARGLLPQWMMTSYWVTGSLVDWMRAYKLRIEGSAQKEIQDLAVLWDNNLTGLYPNTWRNLK